MNFAGNHKITQHGYIVHYTTVEETEWNKHVQNKGWTKGSYYNYNAKFQVDYQSSVWQAHFF
jgi:hypothetical protein